jgi:hypothetical protein
MAEALKGLEGCRNHVHVTRRLRRRPQRRRGRSVRLVRHLGRRGIPHRGSDPMTFKVSEPSAEHLRSLWSELGAVLTGRRTFEVAHGWGGNRAWGPAFVLTHHTRRMAATQLDCPLRDRWSRKRRDPGQSRRRWEVRCGPRRGHDPAVPERRAARRNPHRHRGATSWLRRSTL